jgi:hypothetical protein
MKIINHTPTGTQEWIVENNPELKVFDTFIKDGVRYEVREIEEAELIESNTLNGPGWVWKEKVIHVNSSGVPQP